VATEPKRVHLQFDADARLAAAAGGAARFLADTAGLESSATAQLQSSVVTACIESFDHLTNANQHLDVILTRYADRIEVALSFPDDSAPAVGLDTIAGFAKQSAAGAGARHVFTGVDRVQYETHDGEAVTRLTKYIGQLAPRR
jgi:hypothetical protein